MRPEAEPPPWPEAAREPRVVRSRSRRRAAAAARRSTAPATAGPRACGSGSSARAAPPPRPRVRRYRRAGRGAVCPPGPGRATGGRRRRGSRVQPGLQRDDLALQLSVSRGHLERLLELQEGRSQLPDRLQGQPQEAARQDVVRRVAKRRFELDPRALRVARVEQRPSQGQPCRRVRGVVDEPRRGRCGSPPRGSRPCGAPRRAGRTAASPARARAGGGVRRCGSQPRWQKSGAGPRPAGPALRACEQRALFYCCRMSTVR